MKRTNERTFELDPKRVQEALRRAEAALPDEDYKMFKAVAESYAYIVDLARDENMTTDRLREILLGPSAEQTETVIDNGMNPETPHPGERRSGGDA
jgi:hypothetical protein